MNNFFEDGEIRIGVQSPGPGWVRLDGSRVYLKNKKIVNKSVIKFWSTQTSNSTSTILSVAYGNGVWVAAGAAGTLRTLFDAPSYFHVNLQSSYNVAGYLNQ